MPSDYDIVGDVHGYATPLRALLAEWGYAPDALGIYRHPAGRRVIFVGDYIDRGPEIVATLRLVRAMVSAGQAIALMGNHEYNFVALEHRLDGRALRSSDKLEQHSLTLAQLRASDEDPGLWRAWMRSLPIWYEEPGFRVVHACWDDQHMNCLRRLVPSRCLATADWDTLFDCEGALSKALDCALKGKEAKLPLGISVLDRDGRPRSETRLRWWLRPVPRHWGAVSLFDLEDGAAGLPFDAALLGSGPYAADAPPLFFGHYWLHGRPRWLSSNACCLDYSVADGGSLVGCRLTLGSISSGELTEIAAGGGGTA